MNSHGIPINRKTMGVPLGVFTLIYLGFICFANPVYAQSQTNGNNKVALDQKLNAQLPLDAVFKDETGKTVMLGDYFGSKPVVLNLVWYNCPSLCGLELQSMVKTFQQQKLKIGKDFNVVTISIDPKETPALAMERKQEYIQMLGQPSAASGWHFLTGDSTQIHRVADAIGYKYYYDPTSQQYIHPAGILIITPSGRVSKYFYGIEYHPEDLRLGLVSASKGKVGSFVDQILLICCQYDPQTGRYSLVISKVLKVAGGLTIMILLLFWMMMVRLEKRLVAERNRPDEAPDNMTQNKS